MQIWNEDASFDNIDPCKGILFKLTNFGILKVDGRDTWKLTPAGRDFLDKFQSEKFHTRKIVSSVSETMSFQREEPEINPDEEF